MSQENLIRFGECVLALHEKLRTFVKESDLFEELNSMIHKMMDTTAKRSYSMGRTSSYSKNCRETSITERRNSPKTKKVCYTFNSSKPENGVSDFKMIKPCFVKLHKICDTQLNTLLARKMYPNKVRSNSGGLEMPSLHSIEMKHNSTKILRPDKNIVVNANINIDPKFLATEDHLDLLMAKEMGSSYLQRKTNFNGRDKCEATKSVNDCNLNPVVLLERLSPQFISKAIDEASCNAEKPPDSINFVDTGFIVYYSLGKLEIESHEFIQGRKRKVSTLQRMAVTNVVRRSKRSSVVKLECSCCSKSSSSGLRRSERLGNISLLTESQNSCFYKRINSCPSRRQYEIKDDKETIFGDKENLPRPRKRSNEKINNSDDEEEFYGFETQTNNRHRIKKMKEALKTLNAQPSGKERRRILKVKEPLKTYCPHPSGKENGRTAILNRDFKSFMRHKVPFKAVNRVEAKCSTNQDNIIFKNPTIEDYQSSIRDNHLNVRNKMMMVHRNNAQYNDDGADLMALNRLEILKLFKKREKLLISKMVRDQGKIIVSKTGELLNEDKFSDESLNYYSDEYYIKKIGRRKPLWAEESIRNVIIESQEQIPTDIIAGYFQEHNLPDPARILTFLENAFIEKDDIAVKVR